MIAARLSRLPRGVRTCILCALAVAEPLAHACGVHLGLEGFAGPLMSAVASDAE